MAGQLFGTGRTTHVDIRPAGLGEGARVSTKPSLREGLNPRLRSRILGACAPIASPRFGYHLRAMSGTRTGTRPYIHACIHTLDACLHPYMHACRISHTRLPDACALLGWSMIAGHVPNSGKTARPARERKVSQKHSRVHRDSNPSSSTWQCTRNECTNQYPVPPSYQLCFLAGYNPHWTRKYCEILLNFLILSNSSECFVPIIRTFTCCFSEVLTIKRVSVLFQ